MTKRCKAAFAAAVGGVPRVMRPGVLVPDNDPVLKGREHLFEDVEAFMERRAPRVEEATDEPNARRSLSRRGRQAAGKKAAAKPRDSKSDATDVSSGQGATEGADEA